MLKSTIKHKNVEFTELFYDLVFVYAISKTTELIHHLHGGVVGGEAFFAFIMTTFVLRGCFRRCSRISMEKIHFLTSR